MDPARFSLWQMTGSYINIYTHTKHQGTPAPSRQLKQCSNNWIAYPSSVTAPDLASIQARHKHCARLTTEQQTNRCQQSHLMELWSNEHVWNTLGSTSTECWPTDSTWKQQHWSARKVYQSWRLWLQRVLNSVTSSYHIKMWCSVSLTMD